jgi:hypothetical protein
VYISIFSLQGNGTDIGIDDTFRILNVLKCRLRWPSGLKDELSSLTRTLGLWVRILIQAWISVCAFVLCLCCSVCR